MQRIPSGHVMEAPSDEPYKPAQMVNGGAENSRSSVKSAYESISAGDQPGLTQLVICVAGIYASL